MNINSIISNRITIKEKEKFAAIIGANPSKGARSPKLWNKVYKHQGLNIKMYPLDVDEKKFNKLMNYLSKEKNFLGGAITNPYKEKAFKFLESNINKYSKPIGAINCIYKKNGKLFGTNTDVDGAIFSLNKLGKMYNKKYVVIGTGGTSLTFVSLLKKYVSRSTDITVVGRNIKKLYFFQKKFKCNFNLLSNFSTLDKNIDFLINCTDLGSKSKKNKSVLSESFFKKIDKKIKVFDVVYDPKITLFLNYAKKNGLKIKNGLDMNLHQAVSAFVITNNIKINNYKSITKIMSKK